MADPACGQCVVVGQQGLAEVGLRDRRTEAVGEASQLRNGAGAALAGQDGDAMSIVDDSGGRR